MAPSSDQDGSFWPSLYAQLRGTELDSREWFSPLASAVADDGEYLIRVELPGVAQADIAIKVQQDSILIEGTKANPEQDGKGVVFFDERLCGKFIRTFKLPADADLQLFSSDVEHGVLHIHVPRRRNVTGVGIHPEVIT